MNENYREDRVEYLPARSFSGFIRAFLIGSSGNSLVDRVTGLRASATVHSATVARA